MTNRSRAVYVLETPVALTTKAEAAVQERWKAATVGTEMEGSVLLVTPPGFRLRPLSPEAADRFGMAAEACRVLGLTEAARAIADAISPRVSPGVGRRLALYRMLGGIAPDGFVPPEGVRVDGRRFDHESGCWVLRLEGERFPVVVEGWQIPYVTGEQLRDGAASAA